MRRLIALLLLAASCGNGPDDADDDGEDTVLIDTDVSESTPTTTAPVPEEEDSLKTQQQVQIHQVEKQKSAVKSLKTDLMALEFYLSDQEAKESGKLPKEWKQPSLEEYKKEPGCRAPYPHGHHIPLYLLKRIPLEKRAPYLEQQLIGPDFIGPMPVPAPLKSPHQQ